MEKRLRTLLGAITLDLSTDIQIVGATAHYHYEEKDEALKFLVNTFLMYCQICRIFHFRPHNMVKGSKKIYTYELDKSVYRNESN